MIVMSLFNLCRVIESTDIEEDLGKVVSIIVSRDSFG